MGNGAPLSFPRDAQLNVYALVIYIPDPLGRFLDDLRRELVPHCNAHAHVSVLPPRALTADPASALEQARGRIGAWSPFQVELTDIQTFRVTEVLYLDVGAGAGELRRMHAAMSGGELAFAEPFPYHPHVTLAQEVPHEDVAALGEAARRRWREYGGARSFRAERAMFVQNTGDHAWIDLAELALREVAVR